MKQSAEGFTDSVSALESAQKEIALQTAQLSKINSVSGSITELQQNLTFKVSAENTLTEVLPFLRRQLATTSPPSSAVTERVLSSTLPT